MKAIVRLGPEVTPSQVAAFASIPEFDVRRGKRQSLEIGGIRRRLVVLALADVGPGVGPPPGVAHADDSLWVVVGSRITADQRARIERAGLSWCDAQGAAHVTSPGVYFHVERAGRAARARVGAPSEGLGVVAIRGIQTVVERAGAPWTVASLADAASLSTGQAHKVLKLLDGERLLEWQGGGPMQRRYLRDRDRALQWLASLDQARRRPERAGGHLYARSLDDLITRFAKRAEGAGVDYGVTGAAGAAALGFTLLTTNKVLQVRVSNVDAVEALTLLDLRREEAGRGMNVELWTDKGGLGAPTAEGARVTAGGVCVAPRTRIWIDMLRLGGRDADAAALFKEQAID